jgi:uncharacterized protein YndB with AHSA1/START domain
MIRTTSNDERTDVFVANVERTFAIDRPTMWRLWTDPDHLAQWFRPSLEDYGPTVAKVDLRAGGEYRIEMVQQDGHVHATSGQFVEVDEPNRLSFTWLWDGGASESLVDIAFTEEGGGTSVVITHTRLSSPEDVERHSQGWIGCLNSLALSHGRLR